MPTVNKTIELPAPPEQVWSHLTDFSTYGEWNTVHVGFPDGAPSAVDTSTTYREKVKIMGMPGEVNWAVVECEEGRALGLDGKGPMGTHMKQRYTLSPVDGGTRLELDNEFGGAAIGAMAGALVKESDKALGESLEKLKARLA